MKKTNELANTDTLQLLRKNTHDYWEKFGELLSYADKSEVNFEGIGLAGLYRRMNLWNNAPDFANEIACFYRGKNFEEYCKSVLHWSKKKMSQALHTAFIRESKWYPFSDEKKQVLVDCAHTWWNAKEFYQKEKPKSGIGLVNMVCRTDPLYFHLRDFCRKFSISLPTICRTRGTLLTPNQIDEELFKRFAPWSVGSRNKYANSSGFGVIVNQKDEVCLGIYKISQRRNRQSLSNLSKEQLFSLVRYIPLEENPDGNELVLFGNAFTKSRNLPKFFEREPSLEQLATPEGYTPPDIKLITSPNVGLFKFTLEKDFPLKEMCDFINYKRIEENLASNGLEGAPIIHTNNIEFSSYLVFKFLLQQVGKVLEKTDLLPQLISKSHRRFLLREENIERKCNSMCNELFNRTIHS